MNKFLLSYNWLATGMDSLIRLIAVWRGDSVAVWSYLCLLWKYLNCPSSPRLQHCSTAAARPARVTLQGHGRMQHLSGDCSSAVCCSATHISSRQLQEARLWCVLQWCRCLQRCSVLGPVCSIVSCCQAREHHPAPAVTTPPPPRRKVIC